MFVQAQRSYKIFVLEHFMKPPPPVPLSLSLSLSPLGTWLILADFSSLVDFQTVFVELRKFSRLFF
jgi:hypothetical protein